MRFPYEFSFLSLPLFYVRLHSVLRLLIEPLSKWKLMKLLASFYMWVFSERRTRYENSLAFPILNANDHVTRFTLYFPCFVRLKLASLEVETNTSKLHEPHTQAHDFCALNIFLDTQCHSFIIAIMQCSIMCYIGFNCYNFFQAFCH